MGLCGSAPSVPQFILCDSPYLSFYSRSLIGPVESEKTCTIMHHGYSATLRSLFQFADDPSRYDDEVNIELGKLSHEGLIGLLQSPTEFSIFSSSSSTRRCEMIHPLFLLPGCYSWCWCTISFRLRRISIFYLSRGRRQKLRIQGLHKQQEEF
jgi:hypothetical protein